MVRQQACSTPAEATRAFKEKSNAITISQTRTQSALKTVAAGEHCLLGSCFAYCPQLTHQRLKNRRQPLFCYIINSSLFEMTIFTFPIVSSQPSRQRANRRNT